MLRLAITSCVLATILVLPAAAQAAINKQMSFQGRLTDSSGVVVADGTYNVEFKLHNDPATSGGAQGTCSGSCLWMETRTAGNRVTVSRGQFSVMLGEVTSLGAFNFNQDPLYLSIRIGGTAVGPVWDGEMTPRRRLGSAPTAIYADAAGTATTATSATTATTATTATNSTQLNGQAASYYTSASNIGAGTLADGRLSSNVALKNINNSFSTNQSITGSISASAGGSITGQLALPTSGTGGGLLLGGDTNLYRSTTSTLRTSDSLVIDGALTVGTSLTFSSANPAVTSSSYFIAPGGAYFNSLPVYTEASLRARGGIQDDTGTNLVLSGGTSGNTQITGALVCSNCIDKTDISAASVGANEITGIAQRSTTLPLGNGANGNATAACNAGEYAISGGYYSPVGNNTVATSSYRFGTSGWTVHMRNNSGAAQTFTIYVYCLQA